MNAAWPRQRAFLHMIFSSNTLPIMGWPRSSACLPTCRTSSPRCAAGRRPSNYGGKFTSESNHRLRRLKLKGRGRPPGPTRSRGSRTTLAQSQAGLLEDRAMPSFSTTIVWRSAWTGRAACRSTCSMRACRLSDADLAALAATGGDPFISRAFLGAAEETGAAGSASPGGRCLALRGAFGAWPGYCRSTCASIPSAISGDWNWSAGLAADGNGSVAKLVGGVPYTPSRPMRACWRAQARMRRID
ncbi:MAG: hypothetical protein M5R42_01575 [Rhodocyclaceae bacterium]|nr:hypothetical protein [Rhodocyclaceae bacterium]